MLKGIAAGHLLYPGEHHLRFSSDIDILVAPDELAVAEDVLRQNDFMPEQEELAMPKGKRSALLLMVSIAVREAGFPMAPVRLQFIPAVLNWLGQPVACLNHLFQGPQTRVPGIGLK